MLGAIDPDSAINRMGVWLLKVMHNHSQMCLFKLSLGSVCVGVVRGGVVHLMDTVMVQKSELVDLLCLVCAGWG